MSYPSREPRSRNREVLAIQQEEHLNETTRPKNFFGRVYLIDCRYFYKLRSPCEFMLTLIEAEALKNVGIDFNDLLAGKPHFLIRIDVVAVERQRLFHSLVHDIVQTGFVGITKLLIERADDLLRALDQIIVVQNQ